MESDKPNLTFLQQALSNKHIFKSALIPAQGDLSCKPTSSGAKVTMVNCRKITKKST